MTTATREFEHMNFSNWRRHKAVLIAAAALLFGTGSAVRAQVPPKPAPDQSVLLKSDDPKLAANKKLVYDMWRELFEAAHFELADKYLAEDYTQHNPNVPTGRQGFVDFFSKVRKPMPIEPRVKAQLIHI